METTHPARHPRLDPCVSHSGIGVLPVLIPWYFVPSQEKGYEGRHHAECLEESPEHRDIDRGAVVRDLHYLTGTEEYT